MRVFCGRGLEEERTTAAEHRDVGKEARQRQSQRSDLRVKVLRPPEGERLFGLERRQTPCQLLL